MRIDFLFANIRFYAVRNNGREKNPSRDELFQYFFLCFIHICPVNLKLLFHRKIIYEVNRFLCVCFHLISRHREYWYARQLISLPRMPHAISDEEEALPNQLLFSFLISVDFILYPLCYILVKMEFCIQFADMFHCKMQQNDFAKIQYMPIYRLHPITVKSILPKLIYTDMTAIDGNF